MGRKEANLGASRARWQEGDSTLVCLGLQVDHTPGGTPGISSVRGI